MYLGSIANQSGESVTSQDGNLVSDFSEFRCCSLKHFSLHCVGQKNVPFCGMNSLFLSSSNFSLQVTSVQLTFKLC